MAKIKVGDTVLWRGGFGCDAPKPAKIVAMDKSEHAHDKNGGYSVAEADWNEVNYLTVTLDNNHWAYGTQLFPMCPERG